MKYFCHMGSSSQRKCSLLIKSLSLTYSYKWITLSILQFPYFFRTHVCEELFAPAWKISNTVIFASCNNQVTIWYWVIMDPFSELVGVFVCVKHSCVLYFTSIRIQNNNMNPPTIIISIILQNYLNFIYHYFGVISAIKSSWRNFDDSEIILWFSKFSKLYTISHFGFFQKKVLF